MSGRRAAKVDLLVNLLYFLYPSVDCFHIWTVILVDGLLQHSVYLDI